MLMEKNLLMLTINKEKNRGKQIEINAEYVLLHKDRNNNIFICLHVCVWKREMDRELIIEYLKNSCEAIIIKSNKFMTKLLQTL